MCRTRCAMGLCVLGVLVLVFAAGESFAGDNGRVVLDVDPHWQAQVEEVGRMQHVAMPIPFDADLADLGVRHMRAGGEQILTLHLESPGAVFMSAKFSRFIIPQGVSVTLIARDNVYQTKPFTSAHTKSTGRFGTPMIPGDQMTIEVRVPAGAQQPELVLESVSHGYKDVLGMGRFFNQNDQDKVPTEFQRGGMFDCQRDIVCSEGLPYIHLKDAFAEGYDGAYVCSGQLINNTLGDGRLLYLTAEHCGWWKDPSTMTYYWNYANVTCGGNDYPAFTYSTGSVDLYHSTNPNNDINLLELDGTDLDAIVSPYWLGWNRGQVAPTNTVAISFPADKPLQIVIDNDPTIDCAAGGCPNGWGTGYWRIIDYEVGMPEGGSSGSGLLDQNQLLVGVLTGGVGEGCDGLGWDEYFKLSAEWSELGQYLDPNNTGVVTVPGWDGSTFACPADFTDDGLLNFFDISAFLQLFNSQDPASDLTGDGAWDFFDVSAFLAAFAAGCP